MIFQGMAELSLKQQVLMCFRCRFKLCRDEKDSMHQLHQYRFPVIRSAVMRFKVPHTPFVGSSQAGLQIEYTPFENLYVWKSTIAMHSCTVGFTSMSRGKCCPIMPLCCAA